MSLEVGFLNTVQCRPALTLLYVLISGGRSQTGIYDIKVKVKQQLLKLCAAKLKTYSPKSANGTVNFANGRTAVLLT